MAQHGRRDCDGAEEEDGAHDEGTRASNAGTDHASSDHGSGAPDAAPDGEGEARRVDEERIVQLLC